MAQDIVIIVHGIRTAATWAEMVARVLKEEAGVKPVPVRYGYFDLLRFLGPAFTRQKPIDRVTKQIRAIRTQNPDARISVLAHSFGTYIISKILLREADITLHRVALCGSIIDEAFEWELVKARVQGEIVNDCGTRDIFPVLARGFGSDYGDSGTNGMAGALVTDRFHPYGHSEFFEEKFVRNFWVPFFRTGEIVQLKELEKRETPSWLYQVLGFRINRWIALAAPVLLAAFLLPFEAKAPVPETRFNTEFVEARFFKTAGGTIKAEFRIVFVPTKLRKDEVATVFYGLGLVYDDDKTPKGGPPKRRAHECGKDQGCVVVSAFDHSNPNDEIVIRGDGVRIPFTWHEELPADVKRVLLRWFFYQREYDGGARCEIDHSRPKRLADGTPFVHAVKEKKQISEVCYRSTGGPGKVIPVKVEG